MPITNSSCVDVIFRSAENLTIDWTLYSSTSSPPLASGTTANDTWWTGCFNEPFRCAELTALLVSRSELDDGASQTAYSADIHVVWNDSVWAEGYTGLDPNNEVSVAWIGNECHKDYYQICNYNPNTWLLDVELTTKVSDSPGEFLYWVVYSDFLGSRANIFDHVYYFYQSNTTYRSLSCIEYNGGCNELGLPQQSAVARDPIIRVNGIVKAYHWNCSQDLCEGKIVTPLQGCSKSLSGGAIAGIVVAAVLGAAILYWAAARFIRRNRNECSSESPREQVRD